MFPKRSIFVVLVGVAAGFVAGCATAQVPPELVDARRAYAEASQGPARELTPAQLLTAQQALERAEGSFQDKPDSPRTRDLAYIAERKAEIASAQGALAMDLRNKAQAQADISSGQANELSSTRAQLASDQSAMAAKDQQLTEEQRARRDAERRLHAAMASLEKIAAVKEEARGLVITLNGSVLFATNQSTLLPIAQDRLQEVSRALQDNPRRNVLVEGYTDSTGSARANEDLSRRRAESVRAYLISQGMPADRIRAVGMGANRPIADNSSAEGRANNRRVEIVMEPEGVARQ